TARPVGVQHSVGESQHPLALPGHERVAVVILLERALALARPGRVVLAAVDLDVHVRPDLPVEAADAGHVGLRLPGDARVAAPQSREGLTMRLVATLDEFAPRLRVLRCPHDDRVHAMLRPAKAMQAGAAAGDGA